MFGADHHGYVARLRAAALGMGENPDRLEIQLVQFAVLYRFGEKVAMSTRSGQFITLRELREEVGYTAADFELLNSYHLMAPRGDMQMYVVLARDIRQIGEQALEPTEEIAVQWFTLDDLRAAWLDGAIGSANHAQAVARGLAAAGAL